MDQKIPTLDAEATKAPIWRPLRFALFTILFGLGGVFGWGAFAMIDSAVVAPGTLMVELNRRNVQHLEGGIVGEVLVREGDIVAAGQPLIQRGEPSDCVLVLLQGQASVVVPTPSQTALRLAGVRSGSLIGEIGFLDRRERSATVLAETPVKVGRLHRTVFEELARTEPQLVQQLLTNISLDLANRLRNTNQRAATFVSGGAAPSGTA